MQDSLAKQTVNGDFNTERWRQVTGLLSRGVWVCQDAVDDLWLTEGGAEWRPWGSERDCRDRTGRDLRRTGEDSKGWLDEYLSCRRPSRARRRVVEHHQAAGTDICALAKATGTHPAGVAERSTMGSVLAVAGAVVVAKVCELVNSVSATAMTTIASAQTSLSSCFHEAQAARVRVDGDNPLLAAVHEVGSDGTTCPCGHGPKPPQPVVDVPSSGVEGLWVGSIRPYRRSASAS